MQANKCLPLSRILFHLGWLSNEPSFYGVIIPCGISSCNCNRPKCETPWSALFRQNFFSAVESAIYRFSTHLDKCWRIGLCPEVQQCTLIDQCPQELGVEIAYIGKRVDESIGEYTVDYIGCGLFPEDNPCPPPPRNCVEDYYGRIFIPVEDLPTIDDEIVPLEQLCFNYCSTNCVKDYQFLQEPCPIKYVRDEEDAIVGVLATWKKWLLADPCKCNIPIDTNEGFIEKVCVSYWYVDESQALDIYPTCNCSRCYCPPEERTIDDFDITITNPKTGEICIRPNYGCGAIPRIYLNYGIVPPKLPPSAEKAVALLALTELGRENVCFKCGGFSTYHWLTRSDDAGNLHDKVSSYLFGSTYAEMYAERVVKEICMARDSVRGRNTVYAGIL